MIEKRRMGIRLSGCGLIEECEDTRPEDAVR
jgi:hypothetical protein